MHETEGQLILNGNYNINCGENLRAPRLPALPMDDESGEPGHEVGMGVE